VNRRHVAIAATHVALIAAFAVMTGNAQTSKSLVGHPHIKPSEKSAFEEIRGKLTEVPPIAK
jgi:hypothetical protein